MGARRTRFTTLSRNAVLCPACREKRRMGLRLAAASSRKTQPAQATYPAVGVNWVPFSRDARLSRLFALVLYLGLRRSRSPWSPGS